MSEPVFTVDQVAQGLNLHVRTVRRALERGDFPGTKVGRAWQIPGVALLRTLFVEGGAQSPALSGQPWPETTVRGTHRRRREPLRRRNREDPTE